ncbi:MAG TPA: oxygenase MpaB family protein [Acidimicrobiales bacterium]|nr:oxygenase MpaB family protein [Acidimicrobiales bacterium]
MNRGVTTEHIHSVVAIEDRVLRNYWVTQTYADISAALAILLSPSTANWCTYAVWASRSVGGNMRGEALPSWLRAHVLVPDGLMGAIEVAKAGDSWGFLRCVGHDLTPEHVLDALRELLGEMAVNLSDGNTEVFAEITPPAAVFIAQYSDPSIDHAAAKSKVLDACANAWVVEGANRLREGYSLWCDAMETSDPATRSQLILAGSLQLGAHEQSHLQPPIASAMEMGINQVLARLTQKIAQAGVVVADLDHALNRALRPALAAIADLWDSLMTATLSTLTSPEGTFRLDHDVPPIAGQPFEPPELRPVIIEDLKELLTRFDRSQGSAGSRARDWANFADRMNFIANLFVSRHHLELLFEPPFDEATLNALLADQIPGEVPAVNERGPGVGLGTSVPTIGSALFTDAFLESLRQVSDPPADSAVSAFFEHAEHSERGLYPILVHNKGATLTDEEAPGVAPFVRALETWPDWADSALVERGQRVFGDWGMQLASGLFMASLPMTYACAKGAEPLVRTARMMSNPKRRFLETGQMIVDVMTPGALMPGKRGYETVRHVRLMHAAVRHTLTHPGDVERLSGTNIEAWDLNLGEPLNQEDLLGCLLAFSVLGLRSLQQAGIKIEPLDAEAYVHAWNLVGFQIGVRPDLLPLNLADATEVANRIFARQSEASVAGRELTGTAIEAMQDLLKLRLLRGLPASGIRYYLGDDVATLLGVGPSNWTRAIFHAMRLFDRTLSRLLRLIPGQHSISAAVGRRIVLGLEVAERGGARPGFQITDELKAAWGISLT